MGDLVDPEDLLDALDAEYRELRGVVRENDDPPRKQKRNPVERESKTRVSPVKKYVRSLGRNFKVVSEVAEELGVSSSFIRLISDEKRVDVPTYKAQYGKHEIRVYTPDDVEKIRQYLEGRYGLKENEDG